MGRKARLKQQRREESKKPLIVMDEFNGDKHSFSPQQVKVIGKILQQEREKAAQKERDRLSGVLLRWFEDLPNVPGLGSKTLLKVANHFNKFMVEENKKGARFMALTTKKPDNNRKLFYEIADIMETYCNDCKIKKSIRAEHGASNEQRYCNELCKTGRLLQEKGKHLDKMDGIRKGDELTPERYEVLKRSGHLDKEIIDLYGISMNTLTRRKRKWGLTAPKEFTKEMYKGMRRRGYTDKEICSAHRIGHDRLTTMKRKWGLLYKNK